MTQETIGPEDAPVYTTNHRMPFARRSVNTVFFLLLILIIIGAGSYGLIYIADKESVTLFQDQETAPQDDPVEISDAVQNLSDNPDALFDKEEQDLPVQKKLQMQRGASAPNVNDFVQPVLRALKTLKMLSIDNFILTARNINPPVRIWVCY